MGDAEMAEFCVKDLKTIKEISHYKVLAGAKGLNRRITRVNIMEVPDVENWVHENEFLVTTGYPFMGDISRLASLIPKLVEKNVAALGIKTKRYIEKVPKDVIACADKYNFPIIELPETTAFSNLVREVMEKIIFREQASVALLQDRIEEISRAVLQDDKMSAILEKIEAMINNPVFIIDDKHMLIAAKDTLELIGSDTEFIYSEIVFNHQIVVVGDKKLKVHTFKLLDALYDGIYLVVLEKNLCMPIDIYAIEQLQSLISIKLKTDNMYRNVEQKYVDKFVIDWLSGTITSQVDFELRTQMYGYELKDDCTYRVLIVKNNYEKDEFHADRKLMSRYKNYESMIGVSSWLTINDGKIVIIYVKTPKDTIVHENILENIYQVLKRIMEQKDISLCVSSITASPLRVKESYDEVKNIYSSACICGCCDKVISWDELGIYSILTMIKPGANINKFLEKYITPLKEADDKQNSNLFETLETYFNSKSSIKETAANMYVHYNTILYRLEKIKKILGIDFEDTEELLKINLAIKLYNIYRK